MKPIRFISYYSLLVALLASETLSATGFSLQATAPSRTAIVTRSATSFRGDIDRVYDRPKLLLNFLHAPISQSRLCVAPEAGENIGETKNEPFIRPAIHNSPIFRIIVILYVVLFAVYSTSDASTMNSFQRFGKHLIVPPKTAATVHLLSFATWFGTVVYTTFVAGITMFKNLPRRTFGTLQSKLFPLYFHLCTAMIGVQASKSNEIICFFFFPLHSERRISKNPQQVLTLTAMPDIISKASEVSLAVSFVATLINLLYLEPRSTRVMFDRYSLEDDGKRESDEYKSLAKSFGKFHGMSSLANLIALCGGIVHGVRMASMLVV